jgi:betaine/carnitine transporter, BCCT family
MHPLTKPQPIIDRPMFITTVLVILGIALPIVGFSEQSGAFITHLYNGITKNFGVLYLWYAAGMLLFLIWLGAGRFGKIKLGDRDDHPEFSNLSWISMIFCAGVGAGLLYWAVIEWSYYLQTPPRNLTEGSREAIEWASTYPMFHWGISAWAIYCVPALAIAYPYYVRKDPHLRLSTGCSHYLPHGATSKRARFIDFLYMLNLIGGTGTSLGLSTPMIAASVAELTGLTHNFVLEVSVVLMCIGIFGTSAYLGIQKGFKRLADLNLYVAFGLLFFVLATGPTLFILKMGTNSIGLVLQNFIQMNFWTDPVADTGFVESWTVFYWAWWIAYGPFVGIFVARISRGRTIREVIVGMLTYGSLGAWLFFIVFGNYALHLQINDLLNIQQIIDRSGEATAIAQIILSLPFGKIALLMFLIMAVVFLATTYDSASFTLASVSTKALPAGENPARWNRLFWAFALGIIPICLMFIDGGLKVILSTTIVVSLPLIAVGVLMCFSLVRMLQQDEANASTTPRHDRG